MDTDLHVLVSGGGIAGNAVALQLLRAGIRTTVVERASAPRPGGQAVDLRGPSREVAQRMGLIPGILTHRLDEQGMEYVDRRGRAYVRMPTEMFDGKGPVADIEITRGDLNQVLLDALTDTVGTLDYRYGEWIEAMTQDEGGVDVLFASGKRQRFGLVIGADGVHSATRRLAFGPEEQFSTYLGGYTSYFTVPAPAGIEPGWMSLHLKPRVAVGLRPDADPHTAKALVMLRVDADPALRGDVDAQQRLLRRMLADSGWLTPQILDAMVDAPDFYFDELARIDVPNLSAGRVALLGDAGYCGSPLSGMGTAMALVGAYLLAGELAAGPTDPVNALRRYETAVTPFLDKAKKLPGGGLAAMVQTTRLGSMLGRALARVMASRPLRPVMIKMMSGTDEYELPSYPADSAPTAR
ncbi:2-polyprenyl-6-methoxyphenol hydroxylase-like FAD-dependent oxidoreductase [Rhodococcus sp. SMB37]|uniref:FAD-dependent monooxygenase n=1 Tax=Rhodococcus sp. SMB37 TaxID=2512213 RepID=UPI0006CFDE37|nr:FAD-dependent monooxygenase [Rhodococcus sp. SMB37]TCN56051.1 2-polyprenyl-6-methoxyphenol hydroxylase-like FAD-dependent oxidoreductase [Rhodococcus sp. SMB37]